MSADFKDHFSTQSQHYQRFRPLYPLDMFTWLTSLTPGHELAWDCATGNGQAAQALARDFAKVIATDASEKQIAQCPPQTGVEYRVARAEAAPLRDRSAVLITVAQALHWFDLNAFYREAARVLKANGVLAVWSYQLLAISPPIDAIINRYYHDIVGPYWPPERRLVEQGYAPMPQPFQEIEAPAFAMTSEWNLEELLGYLGTWSASVHYTKAQQTDPLDQIRKGLAEAWGPIARRYPVHWPLQLRVGRNTTSA
jgi:SAM-dependent methyltransferase